MALATTVQSRRSGRSGSTDSDVVIQHNAAAVDLLAIETLINQMRTQSLYRALGNPAFAINSNFDVKNANAISYVNGGTLKTLSANTNFDTGTAATIATTKWNAAILSVDSSGSAVLTWANAAGGASYASEAAAIAALPAAAATDTVLGYVTVQAAGGTWTPGTDALTTGTGGTPANATNYYNSINPNTLYVGAAVSLTTAKIASAYSGTVITA